MAYKFTDAKKWDDVWFSELTMEQKVMFIYLCDMCDIAGFLEVNERLSKFQTGIDDVRGTITSLSKSVLFKNNYVFIKKHIKHQRNLPLNIKNKAHIGIIKILIENENRFPEIYDVLSSKDVNTIILYKSDPRGIDPPWKGDTRPTGIGIGIGIGNNTVTADTPQEESKIARLYKYFVGEENLLGQGVTGGMRRMLVEALQVMGVEEWKNYCEIRLNDEYKSSPNKFFLEDGWRRYQDNAKGVLKEEKTADTVRKESKKRAEMPQTEAPKEFKEFVKSFGKGTINTESSEPSGRADRDKTTTA